MQIAFLLLPKSEIVYLSERQTVRQALEKMQHHGYSSVPVLDEEGRYVGTITTADFLWYLKDNFVLNLTQAEKMLVLDVPRRHDSPAASIDVKLRELLHMAMDENFIPVVDDLGVFIGIVRRREIMEYYQKQVRANIAAAAAKLEGEKNR